MKMHLNLATRDLDASVAFYSTLLDAPPAKRLDDYALFITEQPGLELALDLDAGAQAGHGQHFGIVVETVDAVDAQVGRLQSAGYAVDVEREETCCYANQTKVWASDPEGRRWETYVVHEDTTARDDAETTCCRTEAAVVSGATCCS
jgi:catechol 2,3-dioxygenase-like lactoylglutathione lyase family enzyme